MTRQDKILWGVGAGAIVGLTVLAVALKEDKPKDKKRVDYGLKVDPACNSYSVTSETKIRDGVRAEVRRIAKQGSTDPFEVTRAFLKKAAPHCTTYPSNVRNPGEAQLFVVTLNTVLDVMEDEKLLSQEQMDTFKEMARVWAIDQGVPPESF